MQRQQNKHFVELGVAAAACALRPLAALLRLAAARWCVSAGRSLVQLRPGMAGASAWCSAWPHSTRREHSGASAAMLSPGAQDFVVFGRIQAVICPWRVDTSAGM